LFSIKQKTLGLIAKLSRRKREHKTGNQDYYTKKVQKKKLDATHLSLSHSPSLSPSPFRTCVKRVQGKKHTIKTNRKGEKEHKTSVIVRDAGDHEKKNLRLRRSSSWHWEPASKENPQFKLELLTKCCRQSF
jgi:hypothetical protein